MRDAIPAIAQLRISVFREWPYFYDDDLEYETEYLKVYLNCPESLIDYRPLDNLWSQLGSRKHPNLQAKLSWKEINNTAEITNTLCFGVRALADYPAPA